MFSGRAIAQSLLFAESLKLITNTEGLGNERNQAVSQFGVHNSVIQTDCWNSKFQGLADTLLHHIKEEEDHEKHESKGVYIDFKQLK
jgi:hypothetical protein